MAKLNPDGSVSGTPYQHTEVTVSSSKKVKFEVPMSSDGIRSLGKGKPPPVQNGEATFSFAPSGTITQNVRSNFTSPLPLKVTVSYQVDGKPVSASDLSSKKRKQHSGTLKVTYTIANVTNEQTTVSFEGFNGAQVSDKITLPIPIVAELKLTFPKDASSIDAPKATLATGGGVKATWTLALAPPLSSAQQKVSYSVKLSKVAIPTATLEAEAVVPASAPSGKAPEESAAALAGAEGMPEQGLGGSSESLGQVHSDLDRSQGASRSGLTGQKQSQKTAGANQAKVLAAFTQLQSSVNQLNTTQTNATRSNNKSADAQLSGLQTTADQTLSGLLSTFSGGTSQASLQVQVYLAKLSFEVSALTALASNHAGALANHVVAADALKGLVDGLAALTADLETIASQHAGDASALDQLVVQLIVDANAFPPGEKTTPAWMQLASDLAVTKVKADLVSTVANDMSQRAGSINASVQGIQTKVNALDTDARALSTDAANIRDSLSSSISTAEQGILTGLQNLSSSVSAFQAQLAGAQSTVNAAEAQAHAALNADRATTSADVSAQLQKAQASVQMVLANAQLALDKANSEYAQLVALSQIAMSHQLPGGNAKGVQLQKGAYVFRIAGT